MAEEATILGRVVLGEGDLCSVVAGFAPLFRFHFAAGRPQDFIHGAVSLVKGYSFCRLFPGDQEYQSQYGADQGEEQPVFRGDFHPLSPNYRSTAQPMAPLC